MKLKPRFKIATLLLASTLVAVAIVLGIRTQAIVEHFRYGKFVDVANVNCVGINDASLKIEIGRKHYWTEKIQQLEILSAFPFSHENFPSIQINQVWQWSDDRIYVRMGNEVVAAELTTKSGQDTSGHGD